MPARAGGKSVETPDPLVVGQQAEGMPAKGMANHEQRYRVARHVVHRRAVMA